MIDAKHLFDVIRRIKGAPLTDSDVVAVNRVLDEAAKPNGGISPLSGVPRSARTVADFIAGYIRTHEGKLSMRPQDSGNWTGGKRNVGNLVGSMYGVTAATLAAFRGVKASSITADDMRSLTLDEAVRVGVKLFYDDPQFDLLPVDRVVLSLIDMGWGTGPRQAIKLFQRMIGAPDDGVLGPVSVGFYLTWRKSISEEDAARRWGAVRDAFYTQIATNEGPKDPDRIFLKGWKNRTASFLPGTPWWAEWAS